MVGYKDEKSGNSQRQVKEMPSKSWESPRNVLRGWDSQSRLQPLPVLLPQTVSETEVKSENIPKQGNVGIHWIQGSILEIEMPWLIKSLCVLFGDVYDLKEYGLWKFYDRRYEWPCGVMILFHSTESGSDTTNGRICLVVPGEALELLDPWYIGMFLCNLSKHGFQASRMDGFYDDHERIITPSQLYEKIYQPAVSGDSKPVKEDFTGFKIMEPRFRFKKGVGTVHDELTFGRRGSFGSGKYLRIYDKEKESEGQNDAIRYEAELCDDKAKIFFNGIVEAFGSGDCEKMLSFIGQTVGGCIDFIRRTDRIGDKNLDRLERYPFWQRILDGIGSAKLIGKVIVRTIEKSLNWVKTGVMPTMQMLRKALGPEKYFEFLINENMSDDRLRQKHEKIIADYRFQQEQGVTKYSWQEQGFVLPVVAVP